MRDEEMVTRCQACDKPLPYWSKLCDDCNDRILGLAPKQQPSHVDAELLMPQPKTARGKGKRKCPECESYFWFHLRVCPYCRHALHTGRSLDDSPRYDESLDEHESTERDWDDLVVEP